MVIACGRGRLRDGAFSTPQFTGDGICAAKADRATRCQLFATHSLALCIRLPVSACSDGKLSVRIVAAC